MSSERPWQAVRVATTTPDGIVRRMVLDRGDEHLETLGRVALAAGEQLRAAIEVGDSGEVLVFTNDFSGPEEVAGNDCTGCTRSVPGHTHSGAPRVVRLRRRSWHATACAQRDRAPPAPTWSCAGDPPTRP
ncbi:MAG: hypothetical protein IPN77_33645 [Sandaracinaceae bacterium]|nr:hypothetical protein [Sandaracinaceae bacterium]